MPGIPCLNDVIRALEEGKSGLEQGRKLAGRLGRIYARAVRYGCWCSGTGAGCNQLPASAASGA